MINSYCQRHLRSEFDLQSFVRVFLLSPRLWVADYSEYSHLVEGPPMRGDLYDLDMFQADELKLSVNICK